MGRSEVKKCPKCDGEMKNDLRLVSYTEITVAKENQPVGDYIDVFMCMNCGYIELYKEKKE
jgi:predicted nucleic-acid-binding Zn-ribbon protein